ncbi:MAG TPA: hypothetical protein VGR97_10030 [Candidatus Acidoferrales bacterium]|nr:hypothetical protein [Candidatus Acidoferrales bacterium]
MREQIRSGHARPEQKFALCAGSVPLVPEDRVELLAVLASDSDSGIAERAQNALLTQPLEVFLAACARSDVDPRFFVYCVDYLPDKKGIADALARNASCPTANLARVASHLTSAGIQALLDNLERLISDPQLVLAVVASPAGNTEQRELLGEMEKGAVAMNELEEAAAEIEPDPVKRETLFQKVAHMNVVQRLTLALKGGRSERMLLIRDPNKLVQRCVLQSPRLTDTEVEAFACMTNLSGEILRTISLTRIFMKNYAIVKNLVNNPKTPLDVSLHLFPRLTATDLMKLTANKNIPDTLRSTALKLHRKRKMGG